MAFIGYKFTMLFNCSTAQGFSESWYYSSADSISSLSLTPFDALANARNNLCATGVNLVGYRISDVTDPRKVYAARKPLDPPGNNPPDPISTAILANAYGSDGGGRRQFWMRGVRDDWVVYNLTTNRWTSVGSFTVKFNAFKNLITAPDSNWRLKTINRLKNAAVKTKVTILAAGAKSSAEMTIQSATGFTADSTIVVSGFRKPLSVLNGTYLPNQWVLTTGGSPTITIGNKLVPTDAANAYRMGASIRVAAPDLTRVTHIELGEPRSRRVGRAFFVPAGVR